MRSSATLMLLGCIAGGVTGCTAHNPDFVGAGGGSGDLAESMGACSAGERMCAGTVASDRCEGGMFVVDRTCPAGSLCARSYCAPPATMLGTQIGLRCDTNGGAQQLQCMSVAALQLSCQPFVEPDTQNVRWFCDGVVGAGRPGTHCTRGNECRSGICAANGSCFDACQRDQDCGTVTTGLTCKSVEITVEGVTVTAKSCS